MFIIPPEDVLFHGNGKVAHAGQSETKTHDAGFGWEREDIEGVYSDAFFVPIMIIFNNVFISEHS